jgi:hypothetical protein
MVIPSLVIVASTERTEEVMKLQMMILLLGPFLPLTTRPNSLPWTTKYDMKNSPE